MNFEGKKPKTNNKNQGTSQPEASQKKERDMAWACCCEELVELDDVQLATVVGGVEGSGSVGESVALANTETLTLISDNTANTETLISVKLIVEINLLKIY
jgi:hypothetical protein